MDSTASYFEWTGLFALLKNSTQKIANTSLIKRNTEWATSDFVPRILHFSFIKILKSIKRVRLGSIRTFEGEILGMSWWKSCPTHLSSLRDSMIRVASRYLGLTSQATAYRRSATRECVKSRVRNASVRVLGQRGAS